MASVGNSVPRTDGADKVTGRARYVDDLTFDNMIFGATVRSTDPHATIDEIVFDPDFDWDGITRVTAADIPGRNAIFLEDWDQPALADGLTRHAEEPVALVACADRERLHRALEHVTLKTTPLKPLYDLDKSLHGDFHIFESHNVFKHIDMLKGDVDRGLGDADLILEGEFWVGYQEQMYIEPQGVIAIPDADGGVTVHGSLQCPYYIVKALAPLLGLDEAKVRVIQAVTGGGFGGKEDYPSIISAHASLLALAAGVPVKIIYDRSEDIRATTKRHPARIRHRTAAKRDGTLVAMDIDILMDGGAYMTLSPVVLSRAVIHAPGPYRCPHLRIRGDVVATHTPPNGAFRGFGAPQVAFAIERQMDRLAAKLGMSPLALRRHNLLKLGDTTATGQVLNDSVGSEAVLEHVVERSNFAARWQALQHQSDDARIRQGIGLAFFLHGAGFTGNGEVALAGEVDIELAKDGGVNILSGSTDIGQGQRTVFAQIAADTLNLSMSQVQMAWPNTALVPDSGPTVASRTTMVVGKVVEDAANKLKDEMIAAIAHETGVSADDIHYVNACFEWGDNQVSFERAAKQHLERSGPLKVRAAFKNRDNLEWDPKTYTGDAYPCYAWAAVVTEVEVDMDTYIPKVTTFITAQDIGKAIHPIMCEGQIEGGSLQGIGWASMEELRIKDGRYVNIRMTDCIIPTALDAPEMDVTIMEFPYKNGPHGAKGVGELPMDLPAPAMAAAMEQATGVEIDRVPFSPEMLCKALTAE